MKRKSLKEIKGIRGALYRADRLSSLSQFAVQTVRSISEIRRLNGTRPPITAVVVGRNDDYMSDFADRLRATIQWNLQYLVTHVIFVEWNPPADRELLSFDLARRFPALQAYVVDSEIHRELSQNPHCPLLEFHAKNVGIRRATTPWILATNADAAVAPDAGLKLMKTPLATDVVWLAQRIDIEWHEGQTRPIRFLDCLRQRRIIPYHDLGTGEFAFAAKELWLRAGGYDESLVHHRIGVDKRGVAQMISCGARTENAGRVFHLRHPTSCTEGATLHQGKLATWDDVPYQNNADWGLINRTETKIDDRVWKIT
jgi:hypothetical protein